MSKILTTTEIGKFFNQNSRQMNTIFKELGWIEKVDKGWKILEEGKKNGAIQHNYMGQLSVKWNEDIKDNEKLKKYFKSTNEVKKKTTYKEKIQKGVDYEKFVGKHFEDLGCIIKYNGIENGVKDNSVDIIAINKEEIIFIQCKNWKEYGRKIKHIDIKAFLGDIYVLITENKNYQGYKEKRLFVASNEIFDKSAINYCEEHKELIDYLHLPME